MRLISLGWLEAAAGAWLLAGDMVAGGVLLAAALFCLVVGLVSLQGGDG